MKWLSHSESCCRELWKKSGQVIVPTCIAKPKLLQLLGVRKCEKTQYVCSLCQDADWSFQLLDTFLVVFHLNERVKLGSNFTRQSWHNCINKDTKSRMWFPKAWVYPGLANTIHSVLENFLLCSYVTAHMWKPTKLQSLLPRHVLTAPVWGVIVVACHGKNGPSDNLRLKINPKNRYNTEKSGFQTKSSSDFCWGGVQISCWELSWDWSQTKGAKTWTWSFDM